MSEISEEKKQSITAEQTRVRDLFARIAELGGKGMKEEDIEYVGQKLVLPLRWQGNIAAAVKYLKKKMEEDEETSSFTRVYNFRPWDGAVNAIRALKKGFGMVSGQATQTLFGPVPPKYIQVPISVTETEEVPWGQFTIPLLEGATISFGATKVPEFGQVFQLNIDAPRKHKFVIEGLFKLVEEELKNGSIYRGKAIDGQATPQFFDTSGFDESKVVYAEHVQASLEADLWGPIRYRDESRKEGLPGKRSVLLFGPYGTGKSLAGMRTAVEAVKAGYTFLMARPGRDSFAEVMQTARLYQPAVVFMEDVETVASAENSTQISQMLDIFDGIQAKSTEIMIALTTNHPDALHKGFLRPGRLDAIIEIANLDAAGIAKLIQCVVGKRLAPKINWEPVCEAAEGYLPAFVKEVGDRAIRYMISREGGQIGKDSLITTEDLVHSAKALRAQFKRMQDAPEFSTGDTLAESLGKVTEAATERAVARIATSADGANDEVWNPGALAKAQTATA